MKELQTITTEDLKKKIEAGEDVAIVDVREDEEVAEGMIPGAKHIKMGDIPESLDQLDQDTEYVLICRSGRRSENVGMYLMDHGFKVRNMVGGMLEWTGPTEPKK
ncbi:rhodanese-like domain-containing protein [Falsibacillus pallidus]|uniref:rhodanese-like domain-containing protein n=1 Tax=Falsibacillus pallidus TaxID=493781 RepID=UPI003D9518AA